MKKRVLLLLQFDSPTQIHSLKHKGTHTLPAPDANTHTHTHVQTLLCTKWPPPFSRHTFEEPPTGSTALAVDSVSRVKGDSHPDVQC